ncbi:3-ketoacyl-ACP reductase [Campylobacter mucosalis]|uniref:3-oxoacyl-ACP reductase FabG n=1 Tax=Campylobacter mucosalis TaxID=202 RepID=UPI0004D35976|nr:3-oxoacyl-ACP reductase FabG [Campylobacter mucosalis]KEA45223.1 3-ketoacyl-ACP reductase [Campylobacter mucosalis]QKF63895.1 3-oxoacyl-[acp] reductase [Campylobacter mucosalis]
MQNRVLITGSSRGIGRAIALRLAKAGYKVTINARKDSDELKSLQNELGENFSSKLIFDVSDTQKSREAITDDIEQNGAYYAIILNAGITADNTFVALSEDEWKGVIDVNLHSFYNVLNPSLMPLIRTKKPGRVVAITSVSGVIGNRGQSNYAASKAGVDGAIKSLAIELASRNITVNSVACGVIQTDMTENINEDFIKFAVPAKRAGSVDEVSGVVEFLLSKDASYITRQVIGVNGGLC